MTNTKTSIKLLLQGSEESFSEYEKRLNEEIYKMSESDDPDCDIMVFPSASANGRMCCVINKIEFNNPNNPE